MSKLLGLELGNRAEIGVKQICIFLSGQLGQGFPYLSGNVRAKPNKTLLRIYHGQA